MGGALGPILFAALLDRGLFRQVLLGVALALVLALFTALNVGKSAGPGRDVAPAS